MVLSLIPQILAPRTLGKNEIPERTKLQMFFQNKTQDLLPVNCQRSCWKCRVLAEKLCEKHQTSLKIQIHIYRLRIFSPLVT